MLGSIMEEERAIELLVELHDGLLRLGPGNEASTLRALGNCSHLPSDPRVLDIGCGTGAQTFCLAEALPNAHLTAVDLFNCFVRRLQIAARKRGLEERIQLVEADMNALPFAAESFDLIWSEGAAYIMGFDAALSKWQALARNGGYLVLSEISWFRSDPPQRLMEYWQAQYPGIRSVDENLAAAERLGWESVSCFQLPAEAWTIDYYGPLQERLPVFRRDHAGDPEAQEVAAMTEQEIEIVTAHFDYCGYAFYVLQRP